MVSVLNKFETLKETSEIHTLNDGYEKFVTAHIKAAAQYKLSANRRVSISIQFHCQKHFYFKQFSLVKQF